MRENVKESGRDFEFPLAEILTCAGFFFIYFIEEIVHAFLDSGVHNHHKESIQVHRSFRYNDFFQKNELSSLNLV